MIDNDFKIITRDNYLIVLNKTNESHNCSFSLNFRKNDLLINTLNKIFNNRISYHINITIISNLTHSLVNNIDNNILYLVYLKDIVNGIEDLLDITNKLDLKLMNSEFSEIKELKEFSNSNNMFLVVRIGMDIIYSEFIGEVNQNELFNNYLQ
ncbi:hypothetical protein A0H76_1486 [Hepatospora eriocheir]|uniref:Uncharacterized protein n=1 Tax=Hepatospora eriocheir TaxID=1081669 RepID=A0A1X0QGY6_9MICR|nr:hypothetical protein A0H76_1486 [Hepatospora eriocheir]